MSDEMLMPFQIEGAEWLSVKFEALLADVMGVGKSCQAVRGADLVGAETILVGCPASLRGNWKREFEKFSRAKRRFNILHGKTDTPLPGSVNIVGYDSCVNPFRLEKLLALEYDLLILDEGHFLKSFTARRTQAIYGYKGNPGLVSKAKRVWVLSGTPAPNNSYELYPMVKSLFSDSFKGRNGRVMDSMQFKRKYCELKSNGFGEKIVGGKNLSDLKTRLSPHVLRRKVEDVLHDMPEMRVTNLYLDADKQFSELRELEELDIKIEFSQKLASAKTEKEYDAVLDAVGESLERKIRRILGLAKINPLAEWLTDQLESGMDKVVIFAHHREVMDGLAEKLAKVSHFARIDGSTPATKRDSEVQRFQNDPKCRVFLGQLQAAGTGLTLTAARDLVFAEYSWTPADNEQAAKRIHRIGQKNSVLIRYAVLAGSLDERIADVVRKKSHVISQIFN